MYLYLSICQASCSASNRKWLCKDPNVAQRFCEVFGGIYKWVHIFVHTVFGASGYVIYLSGYVAHVLQDTEHL